MKRAFPGYSLFTLAAVAIVLLLIEARPSPASPHNDPDHSTFTEHDCADCHVSKVIGGHQTTSTMQSPHFDFLCTTCHDPHGSGNLRNIYEELETPNSGVRTVLFLSYAGPNSFADGDAVYDGVCEVCHTSTTYHRNNASGDHTHNAASDCTACHDHSNGFLAVPVTGIREIPRLSLTVFPTPTTGSATFHIVTAAASTGAPTRAAIYDVAGRLVRAFDLDTRAVGERFLQWDGRDSSGRMVRSGVYLFTVDAGKSRQSRKFVVLR
jgi:hypothetical protein